MCLIFKGVSRVFKLWGKTRRQARGLLFCSQKKLDILVFIGQYSLEITKTAFGHFIERHKKIHFIEIYFIERHFIDNNFIDRTFHNEDISWTENIFLDSGDFFSFEMSFQVGHVFLLPCQRNGQKGFHRWKSWILSSKKNLLIVRCSNVYWEHCIYISLGWEKSPLSMKLLIYEMSFYEMSQRHENRLSIMLEEPVMLLPLVC